MKDFKSILLLLLSIGLIGTWFFHFYEKSKYKSDTQQTYIRDSATIAQIIKNVLKDSVKKIDTPQINDTIKSNDIYIDSLKARLDSSVNEVIGLKKEVDDILKSGKASPSDLARSKKLIGTLNTKLEKLQSESKLLESQKSRNTAKQNEVIPVNETITNPSKKKPTKKDSIFVVSDINLSAVNTGENNNAESTVSEADKLVFSFIIRNNILDDSYYDVYVIIIGPGNKVIQADQWAAAENYFATRSGTTAFTKRIRFDYNRGDPKKIVSSVIPERIIKGPYTLKIYYKGILIGQTKRSIS